PDVLFVPAADLDLVAMAFAGDEPRQRARHLDHRVVGGGRPVDDEIGAPQQPGDREADAIGELADATEDAFGLVARRGRVLLERDRSVMNEDEIGERAADVDADAEGRSRHGGSGYTAGSGGHK